jgi:hypothetical protein
MSRLSFFTPQAAETFRSAASVILPELEGALAADRDEVIEIADAALSRRPRGDQQKLLLFLGVVEKLPVLRYGKRFSKLSADKRARVLTFFEQNRTVPKFRQGLFGLKTFVLMGHYGSSKAFAEIGYPGPRMDAPYYAAKEER